jgi:hypothetical protein
VRLKMPANRKPQLAAELAALVREAYGIGKQIV